MKDESIRQGESFEVTLTDTDLTAKTVTITVTNEDKSIKVQNMANYSVESVNGKTLAVATVTINSPALVVGSYSYMYTITYEDGYVEKLPDANSCDQSCDLPKFMVCEANDD